MVAKFRQRATDYSIFSMGISKLPYDRLTKALKRASSKTPCQNDPDLWTGLNCNDSTDAVAKVKCRSCEVIEECLAYALSDHRVSGVWGGLSAYDRSAERKRLSLEGEL
jgi:hypothetical protein